MLKNRTSFSVADDGKKWYLVDASGIILGRLASQVAYILRGKHKPNFTPHVDVGDSVIVINAEKVRLSGKKAEQKIYRWHSGYPGGLKFKLYKELIKTKPEDLVKKSVVGMLPHNKLGSQIAKKLKVYRGATHPHQAQKPEELKLKY
jgi:large subunit ribosomal protein L13